MSDAKPKSETPTVAETDLLKGLGKLEEIAKAQITGRLEGKSDKGTWAYDEEPVEPDEADSDVSTDGGEDDTKGKKSDTDYKPKGSFKRGVDGKDTSLQKGMDEDEPEDDEEEDDEEPPADTEEDDDSADEDEAPKTEKSFTREAKRSKAVRKAMDASPVVRGLVRALEKSLVGIERRIRQDLAARVDHGFRAQRKFQKSLSDVLQGLGAVAIEQADLVRKIAAAPARGPKAQTHAARPLEKSFEGGAPETITLPGGETVPQLDRSVILSRLTNGVVKGLIPAIDVVKFESTGVVRPELYKALASDPRFAT